MVATLGLTGEHLVNLRPIAMTVMLIAVVYGLTRIVAHYRSASRTTQPDPLTRP
ncbi:MAG: hypothetical protein AAGD38_07435 [Acidobacteriota bacterium]